MPQPTQPFHHHYFDGRALVLWLSWVVPKAARPFNHQEWRAYKGPFQQWRHSLSCLLTHPHIASVDGQYVKCASTHCVRSLFRKGPSGVSFESARPPNRWLDRAHSSIGLPLLEQATEFVSAWSVGWLDGCKGGCAFWWKLLRQFVHTACLVKRSDSSGISWIRNITEITSSVSRLRSIEKDADWSGCEIRCPQSCELSDHDRWIHLLASQGWRVTFFLYISMPSENIREVNFPNKSTTTNINYHHNRPESQSPIFAASSKTSLTVDWLFAVRGWVSHLVSMNLSKMVSRRKILSRSRDELHSLHTFQQEDQDDIWTNKDQLYQVGGEQWSQQHVINRNHV